MIGFDDYECDVIKCNWHGIISIFTMHLIQAIYWADSNDIKIQTMFNRSYDYFKQNRLQASHTHTHTALYVFFSFRCIFLLL